MGLSSVSRRFRNVDNGFVWVFTGVCPHIREGRSPFWEELGAIRGLLEDPWYGQKLVGVCVCVWWWWWVGGGDK